MTNLLNSPTDDDGTASATIEHSDPNLRNGHNSVETNSSNITSNDEQPNSTQPRVGLSLFSYGNHNHKTTNHKTKPYPTFSQLLHNQTRPNSVCNLISTQLEDSCQKKLGHPPPLPKKNSKNNFYTKKKLFSSTKLNLIQYATLLQP